MRVKEERREEWDWSSSKAFFRFSFFESMSFRAAEIVFSVAMISNKIGFLGTMGFTVSD